MGIYAKTPWIGVVVIAWVAGLICSLPAAANTKAVVFPPEAINVDEGLGRAVAIAFKAEIQARGFEVIDHRDAVRKLSGTPSIEAESAVLSAGSKGEIAKQLGCDFYFDGTLVRFGRSTQLHMEMHDANGTLVGNQKMTARTDEELMTITARIAKAIASKRRRIEPAKPVVRATAAVPATVPATVPTPPPRRVPVRDSKNNNYGIILGQAFRTWANLKPYTIINFDARFEVKRLMAEFNIGVGLRNEPDPKKRVQMIMNLIASYYLLNSSVTPYVGAGVGMFIGHRLENTCFNGDAGDYPEDNEWDDKECNAWLGVDVFPLVGVELLRHSFMRVHADFRYSFNWVGDTWGHGPVVLMGIAF
jgi:hypothetical protein